MSGALNPIAVAAAENVASLAAHLTEIRRPAAGSDQAQAELADALYRLSVHGASLVYDPPRLYETIDAVYAAMTDAMEPDAVFGGMLSIATGFTATRRASEAETRNAIAIERLASRLALREIGYVLPAIDLDNTERAETIRRQVFELFLAESDAAAATHDDVGFAALIELAHRILDDLDNRAAQLPSLTTFQTHRPVNAITLAHQLYADAERNLEIVARTGARNPAFMPMLGRVLDR
ncbi:MAG: hypothetical protein FWD12_09905 [Alphaproteobacteria bacterium]|nr:hypothetical protein [Alphaproteobacteria bacterium]